MTLSATSVPMFTVVIPVLNQHETTERLIESWFRLAKGRVSILFIDNGSELPLADQAFFKRWAEYHDVRCIRNEVNTGVYPTFQQGMEATDTPFVFFSHNDVEMVDWGWDERMCNILSLLDKPGVCGMFGARGIGTPQINKQPYHFTQLMRWGCITVPSMHKGDPNASDRINNQWQQITVLDGFSLIVSREMFGVAMKGKFDYESFPVHHMYDIDICVTSHVNGYKNYVIDVDCIHHGGVTSTREKWAEEMGTTDLKIHRAAHKVFYDKWRHMLPIGVR